MKICDATGLECFMTKIPNAVLCDISKDKIKDYLIKSLKEENKILVSGNIDCMYELSAHVNINWEYDGKYVQPICCPMKDGTRWIFLIDRDMIRDADIFLKLSDSEINNLLVCEFKKKIGAKCSTEFRGLNKKRSFGKVEELINEYF
jgi:hypothetical protein